VQALIDHDQVLGFKVDLVGVTIEEAADVY
jgi:hypothetical protein